MILTLDFSTILSYGVLGILLGALVINLIPLVSPSNLILSGIFFLMLPNQHPALVGLLVAIGASIAKLLHYQFSYLMGSIFSSKINHRINPHARKLLIEWGSLGVFIAAVSPIPDDPIVFPMGFLRFNIVKFFLAYFTGKTIICLIGAYTASQISSSDILGVAKVNSTSAGSTYIKKFDVSSSRESFQKETIFDFPIFIA